MSSPPSSRDGVCQQGRRRDIPHFERRRLPIDATYRPVGACTAVPRSNGQPPAHGSNISRYPVRRWALNGDEPQQPRKIGHREATERPPRQGDLPGIGIVAIEQIQRGVLRRQRNDVAPPPGERRGSHRTRRPECADAGDHNAGGATSPLEEETERAPGGENRQPDRGLDQGEANAPVEQRRERRAQIDERRQAAEKLRRAVAVVESRCDRWPSCWCRSGSPAACPLTCRHDSWPRRPHGGGDRQQSDRHETVPARVPAHHMLGARGGTKGAPTISSSI